MLKLEFLFLTWFYLAAVQLPLLTCTRQYDVEAEAVRLFGADLRTVLGNFRRSSEYHKILSQKLEEMKDRMNDLLLHNMAAFVKLLKNDIYKKYGIPISSNEPATTRATSEIRGRSWQQHRSERRGRRADRAAEAGRDLLDQLYRDRALAMPVPDRNRYRDMGFEYAGKIIHSLLNAMGPEDTPGKSTRMPAREGAPPGPPPHPDAALRAGPEAPAPPAPPARRRTESTPHQDVLPIKSTVSKKKLTYSNEIFLEKEKNYKQYEKNQQKDKSIEKETSIKLEVIKGRKANEPDSVEFEKEWENKGLYLSQNTHTSSESLEKLKTSMISNYKPINANNRPLNKIKHFSSENLNSLYLWEKTTNQFHVDTDYDSDHNRLGSDGYSGYKKNPKSDWSNDISNEVTPNERTKSNNNPKYKKYNSHSDDAVKKSIKDQWDDEHFNLKMSRKDESESEHTSEDSPSFSRRNAKTYASTSDTSSDEISDTPDYKKYYGKKWKNPRHSHNKRYHQDWYVEDQNDEDWSSLDLEHKYEKPKFMSNMINKDNTTEKFSSENYNYSLNGTKKYRLKEETVDSGSEEGYSWKKIIQISRKLNKKKKPIENYDDNSNNLTNGTNIVTKNITINPNFEPVNRIENSKDKYLNTSLRLPQAEIFIEHHASIKN